MKFYFKLSFRHLMPCKKPSLSPTVFLTFFEPEEERRKARVAPSSPSQTYHLNFGFAVKGEEKMFCTFLLVQNVYSQNRRLELQISPIRPAPTNHHHLQGLEAFTLLAKCQASLKVLMTSVEKNRKEKKVSFPRLSLLLSPPHCGR